MKVLNERAKLRLRIAAGFLRSRGCLFPANGDFYGEVMKALEGQTSDEQVALKELVDWVEEFECQLGGKEEASGRGR